ncbi:MAG: response regulator [Desulfobacterales bacterium]|nr:response regulator [Desulfobacterales bacterium]
MFYSNFSIKWKINTVIIFVSTFVLLFSSIVLFSTHFIHIKDQIIQDLQQIAIITGLNCAPALIFNDENAAIQTLYSLNVKSHIVYAAILKTNLDVFAQFFRIKENDEYVSKPKQKEGFYFDTNSLFVIEPISLDDEIIGYVFIQHDLDIFHEKIINYGTNVFSIFCFSVVLTLTLSNLLQRLISKPILKLATISKQISESKDYSVRIKKKYRDEIGILYDNYNQMLNEIEQRDNHLESMVQKRTEQLEKSNQELIVARDEAWRANRLKSEFLANMSHEIRTPLNAILGITQILNGYIKDEQSKEYLSAISSSGKTLLRLINDILDFSKIEAGKLHIENKPVKIRTVLREIEHMFYWILQEKQLQFILDIDEQLPSVLIIDEMRLRQVFINLVGNAIKFTDKGHVCLKISCNFTHVTNPSSVHLLFAVEDTGKGIPQHMQQEIFQAFTQLDGQDNVKYGGTGLGLTISKRLIEMMGGKIWLESQVGKGTTFYFCLDDIKVVTDSSFTEDDFSTQMDHVVFSLATILVVDDVSYNRKLIKGMLLQIGKFEINEADDGVSALKQVSHHKPNIIFMDKRMPNLSGDKAAQCIKDSPVTHDIPIIIVTAETHEDYLSNEKTETGLNIQGLFDGLIQHPVTEKKLMDMLMRFIPYTFKRKLPAVEIQSIPVSSYDTNLPVSIEFKNKLPELIEILQKDMIPHWDQVRKGFIIDEIANFADIIHELGSRYHADMLIHWGKQLKHQADHFDVAKLPKTIEDFQNIIDSLTNQLTS